MTDTLTDLGKTTTQFLLVVLEEPGEAQIHPFKKLNGWIDYMKLYVFFTQHLKS